MARSGKYVIPAEGRGGSLFLEFLRLLCKAKPNSKESVLFQHVLNHLREFRFVGVVVADHNETDATALIDQVNLRNAAHLVVHVVSPIADGDRNIHPVFREILAIMLELLLRSEVSFLFKIPVVLSG